MRRLAFGAAIVAGLGFATLSQGQVTVEQANLIDDGRRVFMEETFDGNGRTCGTCHIPTEGYNIFPSSIARLSREERDLVFATNVPGLENVDLIEARALFNISGGPGVCGADQPFCFDDDDGHSGPVFRASMGIHALDLTTDVDPRGGTPRGFNGTRLLPRRLQRPTARTT